MAWLLEPSDAVTTITICGMGGRLIADILDAGKDKLICRLFDFLQPNNRKDDLRIWSDEMVLRLLQSLS